MADTPAQLQDSTAARDAEPALIKRIRTVPSATELERQALAHSLRIEHTPALALAQQGLALAERSRSAAQRSRAHALLAHLLTRAEDLGAAAGHARQAVELAKATRGPQRPGLLAHAQLRLAGALVSTDAPAAAEAAQAAAPVFERLGEPVLQSQALRILGFVRMGQADTPAHRAIVEEAIALARLAGDRAAEGRAISTLYQSDMDMAQRLRGLNEALACYIAAGDRQLESIAYHNLSLTYGRLGLYRRAARLIRRSIAMRQDQYRQRPASAVNPWAIVCILECNAGHEAVAREALAQAQHAHRADPQPAGERLLRWFEPIVRTSFEAPSRRTVAALRRGAWSGMPTWVRPRLERDVASAQSDLGQHRAALRTARQAGASLQRLVGVSGGGTHSNASVHWQQARAALRSEEHTSELQSL